MSMKHLQEMGERAWPKGSELPVVYNPEKPRQGFVEKVVVISDIVGIVIVSAGAGFKLYAGGLTISAQDYAKLLTLLFIESRL